MSILLSLVSHAGGNVTGRATCLSEPVDTIPLFVFCGIRVNRNDVRGHRGASPMVRPTAREDYSHPISKCIYFLARRVFSSPGGACALPRWNCTY